MQHVNAFQDKLGDSVAIPGFTEVDVDTKSPKEHNNNSVVYVYVIELHT